MSDIKESFYNRLNTIREEYRSDIDKKQPKWHWHLTDKPDFKIDSKKGPEDMQPTVSPTSGSYLHGRKTKVHAGRLQTVPAGLKKSYDTGYSKPGTMAKAWSNSMPWKTHAVAMDVSGTKKKSFYRGDIESDDDVETLHRNPEKAKVKKIYPIKKAMAIDKRYASKLKANKKFLAKKDKQANRYPKLNPKTDIYEE